MGGSAFRRNPMLRKGIQFFVSGCFVVQGETATKQTMFICLFLGVGCSLRQRTFMGVVLFGL